MVRGKWFDFNDHNHWTTDALEVQIVLTEENLK
jgi:hypothetical protein